MFTEEIKVGDEVRLSHSNLTYEVICLVGEKAWIKDIAGVVGNTIVDKKHLTKVKQNEKVT